MSPFLKLKLLSKICTRHLLGRILPWTQGKSEGLETQYAKYWNKKKSEAPVSPQEIETVDCLSPTFERNLKSLLRKPRPVYFQNLIQAWPNISKINKDFLLKSFGETEQITFSNFTGKRKEQSQTIQETVKKIESGDQEYGIMFGDLINRTEKFRSLFLDLPLFQKFFDKFLVSKYVEMFICPKGFISALHSEMAATLAVQFEGEKQWTITTPSEFLTLPPTEIAQQYIVTSVPKLKLKDYIPYLNRYEVTVKEGDGLYIPSFWGHHVVTTSHTHNYSYRFISAFTLTRHPLLSFLIITSDLRRLIFRDVSDVKFMPN